jgi:hypothetical protein
MRLEKLEIVGLQRRQEAVARRKVRQGA